MHELPLTDTDARVKISSGLNMAEQTLGAMGCSRATLSRANIKACAAPWSSIIKITSNDKTLFELKSCELAFRLRGACRANSSSDHVWSAHISLDTAASELAEAT